MDCGTMLQTPPQHVCGTSPSINPRGDAAISTVPKSDSDERSRTRVIYCFMSGDTRYFLFRLVGTTQSFHWVWKTRVIQTYHIGPPLFQVSSRSFAAATIYLLLQRDRDDDAGMVVVRRDDMRTKGGKVDAQWAAASWSN